MPSSTWSASRGTELSVRLVASLAVVAFALGLASCGSDGVDPASVELSSGPVVRVQLLDDAVTELEITSSSRIELRSLEDQVPLFELDAPLVVRRVGKQLEVNARQVAASALRLVPLAGHFGVRELSPRSGGELRRYLGVLDLIPHEPAVNEHRLRIVNELSVEEYVAGVVGREMEDRRFTLEALKAQAVAARTYTLYHLRKGGPLQLHESFPSSSLFQAYGGMDVRGEAFDAVRQTNGRILTYDGKLFQSFYHSTCGGRTESGTVFHERSIPPLAGVPCKYCTGAPRAKWTLDVPLRAVDAALRGWVRENGIRVGRITGLEPVRGAGGERSLYIEIQHAAGSFELRSDRFRQLMLAAGHRSFHSGDFDVEPRISARREVILRFKGRGFGHGVGLCQYGANSLARTKDVAGAGERGYQAILDHYFPESGIMTLAY